MHEIRILTLLELRGFFGINRFLHTKDKKEKNRYRLFGVVFVILFFACMFYVGGYVFALSALGLQDIVPSYLVMISTLLIFIFGLFKAGHRIFSPKGYDTFTSMPLKSSSLVISRFLVMYGEDLILTFLIFIPGMAVFGILQKPNLSFYPIAFLCTLFIPMLPLVMSALLGAVITAISARMKHKNLVQIALSLLLLVGILIGSFSIQGLSEDFSLDQLSNLIAEIGKLIGNFYPPAVWLQEAMFGTNLMRLLLFLLISIASLSACIFITAWQFHRIMRGLRNVSSKHQYEIKQLRSGSLLRALYIREWKRYFSSTIYVTNTIIGPIMGMILSIALCVAGLDTVQDVFPDMISVSSLLPFVISTVFCMMTTTSTAISMEGKHIWAVKSLPIPTKTLLDSKILLNLSLMLPCYVISETCLIIAAKPSALDLVWLILIPILLMIFSAVIGITINLKFHRFDWEKEEEIVKQSLSAMLGGFAGMLVSLLLIAVIVLIPTAYENDAKIGICILLAVGTICLYQKNNAVKLEKL